MSLSFGPGPQVWETVNDISHTELDYTGYKQGKPFSSQVEGDWHPNFLFPVVVISSMPIQYSPQDGLAPPSHCLPPQPTTKLLAGQVAPSFKGLDRIR